MGYIEVPESGLVYLDASPIIYAIEKISPYAEMLQPLWQVLSTEKVQIAGSELLLLEILVKPIQIGDGQLETSFRRFLSAKEMNLLPITTAVLEEAIRLRAKIGIKTPDAIHAATAKLAGCDLFVTNDKLFERVPGLPVIVLNHYI